MRPGRAAAAEGTPVDSPNILQVFWGLHVAERRLQTSPYGAVLIFSLHHGLHQASHSLG